jgi:hypothetical protein
MDRDEIARGCALPLLVLIQSSFTISLFSDAQLLKKIGAPVHTDIWADTGHKSGTMSISLAICRGSNVENMVRYHGSVRATQHGADIVAHGSSY